MTRRVLGTERLLELERKMREGITFAEIKALYGLNDSAAHALIAKVKRHLKATITVEGRGPHRVFRSVSGTRVSLELPEEQVLPAYFLLRDATERMFAPVMSGAYTLGRRIRANIDSDTERQIARLERRIKLRFIGSRQGNPGIFSAFVNAMARNRTLAIEYQSARSQASAVVALAGKEQRARTAARTAAASGQDADASEPHPSDGLAAKAPPLRHVEPYAIFYARRALYAIVRDVNPPAVTTALRDQWSDLRTLKLSRIAYCTDGGQHFHMPDDFDIEEYLGDAWEIVRNVRTPRSTVVVDVAPEYGINIGDTMWHATQERRVLANGTHRFTFRVRGHDELRYWILWLGEGATVVQPKSLREEVRRLARAIAAKYAD
jgi:predicted DNA-binding transcriptional regulator YafY